MKSIVLASTSLPVGCFVTVLATTLVIAEFRDRLTVNLRNYVVFVTVNFQHSRYKIRNMKIVM